LEVAGQISTCYLALGEQWLVIFNRNDERVTGMASRVMLVVDMESAWMRLEYHIGISVLGTVDDEILPVVADFIFTLDTGQG